MKLNQDAIDVLLIVKNAIGKHPKQYYQSSYGEIEGEDAYDMYEEEYLDMHGEKYLNPYNCEGACCIAGWIVYVDEAGSDEDYGMIKLHKEEFAPVDNQVYDRAREILDISRGQADSLFSSTWPREWLDRANSSDPLFLRLPYFHGGSMGKEHNEIPYFHPTPSEAIGIIDHIIAHGFEEATRL